jgi:hypothetical protein
MCPGGNNVNMTNCLHTSSSVLVSREQGGSFPLSLHTHTHTHTRSTSPCLLLSHADMLTAAHPLPPPAASSSLFSGGYFCDSAETRTECPAGSYCPLGSTAPIDCGGFLSLCPAGSSRRTYMGGILAAFLLDVFVFLLVWIGRMADLRAATAAAAAAAAAGVGVGASSRRASAAFLALGGSSPRNEDDEDDALPPIDLATTTSAAAICDVVAEIRPLGMTLCAVNIVHVVGRGKGRREVLCGVSTAALPAKLTAIMGPSGAGKTCLLKCLAGMITPSSGTVTASVTAVDGPLAGLSGKTQQAFTASHVLSFHPVLPLLTRDTPAPCLP